jgi:tetratricopeptide (TPR) repeat protein
VDLAREPEAEARLRFALAEARFRLGDYSEAEKQSRRAAGLTASSDMRLTILMLLARVHAVAGRREQALAVASEATGLDAHDPADRFNAIGWIVATEGRHEDALALYHQALAEAIARGDRLRQAVTLHNIDDAHLGCGRHRLAFDTFQQGIAICRSLGDRYGESVLLERLAAAYDAAGDRRRARRIRASAAALRGAMTRSLERWPLERMGDT